MWVRSISLATSCHPLANQSRDMDTRIVPLLRPVITPFNLDMKVLLTTEDTAGAMSVIMAWHKPGEGAPDHLHFDHEEIFFIVDGRYELTIDAHTSINGP